MASIDGSRFDITGASGSQGLLGPKSSWRAYILPRGAHASQDSTGSLITVDSTDAASRFAANDWFQAGLSVANIRKVSVSAGNSFSFAGAALTVSQNDRIFLIGTTQPTVTGGSATYRTPATLVRQRDDDGAALFSNSMITSNAEGLIQFWAATNFYDCIIQDGNQTNQASVIDLALGVVGGVSATGVAVFGETVTLSAAFGVTGHATFGDTVTIDGILGVTGWAFFGSSVTMHAQLGVTSHATFGDTVTIHGILGVTGSATIDGAVGFAAGISNDTGVITSSVAADTNSIGHILDTDEEYTAAGSILLEVRNNGTQKFRVGEQGELTSQGTILANQFVGAGAAEDVTIAGDSVTITRGSILVTVESGSTDDLATITPVSSGAGNAFLIVRAKSSAATVVMKDGTGNLILNGDFSLTHVDDTILLFHDLGNWIELSRSDNAA